MTELKVSSACATALEMAGWDARFSGDGPGAHRHWSREKLIEWVGGIEPILKRIWYALATFADEMPAGDLADNTEDLVKLLQAAHADQWTYLPGEMPPCGKRVDLAWWWTRRGARKNEVSVAFCSRVGGWYDDDGCPVGGTAYAWRNRPEPPEVPR